MAELSDKLFLGGLDQDSDPRLVDRKDIVDALNIRFAYTDQSSEGTIENVRGNLPITVPFPGGVINNRCIGAHEDVDTRRIYFFTVSTTNANGSCIFEFNQDDNTIVLLLTDSGLTDRILDFSATSLINDAFAINDTLYWNDGLNSPKKLNITRIKTGGGYPTPLIKRYIEIIQHPPFAPPSASYVTDDTIPYNNLRGKLFQFCYSYIYPEGEESATSPFSKLILPIDRVLPDQGTGLPVNFSENLSAHPGGVDNADGPDRISKNNIIRVMINIGDANVREINVYARIGNTGDWFLSDTLEKSALGLPNNATFNYDFFNTRALAANQELVNRAFDEVPFRANAMELIDGNRLVFGGITSGYDNLDNLDFSVNVLYESEGITNLFAGALRKSLKRGSDYRVGLVYYDDYGRKTFVQTNESGLIHVEPQFAVKNRSFVPGSAPPQPLREQQTPTFEMGAAGFEVIIRHLAPTQFTSYQIVLTESLTISNYISFTVSANKITRIENVPSTDPTFFKIQINLDDINLFNQSVRGGTSETEQRGINYSYTPGDRVKVLYTSVNGSIILPYITSGGLGFPLITEEIDLEILFFDETRNSLIIPTNQDILNLFFNGNPVATQGGGIRQNIHQVFIQIYTPKSTPAGTEIYYEIGEKHVIVDGRHSSMSPSGAAFLQPPGGGPITVTLSDKLTNKFTNFNRRETGDAYFRLRRFVLPGSPPVDDFFPMGEATDFSDFYESNSWDRGRINVVDRTQGRQELPTTVRYSEPFIFNTSINGLSTFFNANFRDYDQNWGSIQRLYSEDKRLIMFQELKVSQILVNENVLFDTDNTPAGTVGQQVTVLNNNTYYVGEFGIGTHPESFAVYGRVKYFVDAPRGAVLRLSQDGITKISDYKMHNFFTTQLQGVVDNLNGHFIQGVFDIRFDEYVLAITRRTITAGEGTVTPGPVFSVTIGFSERKNRWISRYSYEPEYMVQNGTDIITFNLGTLYRHNESTLYNTFYNVVNPHTFTYIVNDQPQFVKAWQNIIIKSLQPVLLTLSNERGQGSFLNESDFQEREDRFYASFLRDTNSPNVTNPLTDGDQLRSDYLRVLVRKETNTQAFHQIFMITTQFRGSPLLK